MKKISIEPLGESALVTTGTPLLAALLAKELNVKMSCGGKGICSTCHVRVSEGMDQLSPIGTNERRTLSLVADSTPESRLACQTSVYGDGVTVRVPEGMYIEKADDLLSLLGTLALENILHPITGAVLIPKSKFITRTLLEQSRSLEQEVKRLREEGSGSSVADSTSQVSFTASSIAARPILTGTTQFLVRATAETKTASSTPSSTIYNSATVVTPPPSAQPRSGMPPTDLISTSLTRIEPPKWIPSVAHTQLVHTRPIRNLPSPSQEVTAVHAGAQVDKYLLLECVGKGGTGVVYRALHTKLKTLVAVKFLRADLGATDNAALERLALEAQLLAQLNHQNVVRVLDFEDHPTRPYVVMEFVDGLSASDLIKQSGRVAAGRAVEIALQTACGLEAARQLGIVHRDVKPGNILVPRTGGCKLVDLGLATMSRPDLSARSGERPLAQLEGTVGYMSPESLTGELGDHRSDIYSLGATLFHLITGRLPFVGRSAAEVILQHLKKPPPDLHDFAPEIAPALSTVIRTMMAKSPRDRYQEYSELRQDLLEYQQN